MNSDADEERQRLKRQRVRSLAIATLMGATMLAGPLMSDARADGAASTASAQQLRQLRAGDIIGLFGLNELSPRPGKLRACPGRIRSGA